VERPRSGGGAFSGHRRLPLRQHHPTPDGERFEGKQAVRAAWEPVFGDPHSHFEIEEVVAADDRVVQRWRYSWGSGHVRGVDLLRFRDGKIAEKLSYVKG
jgi:hypothetical protein